MDKDRQEELQELISQMSELDKTEIKEIIKAVIEIVEPLRILLKDDKQLERELIARGYISDPKKRSKEDQQILQEAIEKVIKIAQAPKVITTKASKIEYPIDKINSEDTWTKNQTFAASVDVKKRNSKQKQDVEILYAIDFSQLEAKQNISISKELTAYDKRVYIAVAALFNAGNKIMSTPMIYHAMGFTGEPGKSDKEQIYNSIIKMRLTAIAIDTTKESEKYDYPKFQYTGTLLPSEDYSAVINGNLTDKAINFLREPPLITFAKGRGQFTTFCIEILQSPLSKTDINLKIEDYLLERIARIKHGTGQPKILYKTIADNVGIKNMTIDNQRNLKKRLPSKVNKYLDYYVKRQFIKKYTTDKDGVIVFAPKEKK